MATIVTRATKGSALTWTEGDANITNLNNDKIESIVADTTPQLGGNLDVNGHSIVSSSNGNISIVPNGSGNINLTPATGHVTISAVNFPTGDGSANQVLKTDGAGNLTWTTVTSGISNISVADNSADANAWSIPFLASGAPSFTSVGVDNQLTYVPSTNILTANTSGAHNGTVGATTPATGAFTTLSASSTVSGTGFSTYLASPPAIGGTTASTVRGTTITATTAFSGALNGTIGATTPAAGAFTTLSASSTVSGTGFSTYLASPPAIGGTAAAAGSFTTLTSTGRIVMKDLTETVYTSGSTTGTITPDVANGTVQKITLTGSITFNAFANPVAGQSLTLIVTQSASGNLTLTSTMKFAGGTKTLSTAANAIDIITVFYDGSTYWASLGKGFA